ncbi:uncharacterized protein LOC141608006 [Silene latifolia]|uniref:uncharacterized protein LOC141608006 n=1 Tax=Silene latifolia TaxID=37657 RepID=UPI003D7706D6
MDGVFLLIMDIIVEDEYGFYGNQRGLGESPSLESTEEDCWNNSWSMAIAGDFNCILAASERYGGASSMAEMEPFRRCVEDCEVVDIAATGSMYTWNNKQRPEERIYSKIDRFLVNREWCDLYPDTYAHFLPEGLFDHSPCLIRSSTNGRGKSSFKYLNMWGSSKEFVNTVGKHWDRGIEGTPLFRLTTNLKGLKAGLCHLNRDDFSDIEKSLRKAAAGG